MDIIKNTLVERGVEYIIPIIKREINGKKQSHKEVSVTITTPKNGCEGSVAIRFADEPTLITMRGEEFISALEIAKDVVESTAFIKCNVVIKDMKGDDYAFVFRRDFTMFRRKILLLIEYCLDGKMNRITLDPSILFDDSEEDECDD